MQIIKLGGSLITDKRRYRKFRRQIVERIAQEVKEAWEAGKRVIVVHGAGSFGHIKAREYQLQAGRSQKIKKQSLGFTKVHCDVRWLNLRIMEAFYKAGLPAVSLPPISIARNSYGKLKEMDVERFRDALGESLLPITFGDVVFDEKLGFSICSGDDLVLRLATHFRPERIIFLCDVPGIYAAYPPKKNEEILREISPEYITTLKTASPGIDVTGGIFGKIQKCFEFLSGERESEIWIISGRNIENFRNALIGKDIQGTKVVIK
ncbi:MAG: isopentenyl phosphate kinase [Thermoplasmata archaeon]